MNFIDAYDITGPTATPPPREGPEPTLNEEVTQVVGQLSRFWGGFRKQSQSVLESARKDLTQVVSQAQKELTKLTTEPAEESTNAPSEKDASTSADSSDAHPAGDSSSGPSTEAPTETSPTRPGHTRGVSVSATAQNLFSRLQASLPADLAATVQAKLPESIKQGAGSIDLGQLRMTLASEFQRVQNITKAQAEEYAHKSEELLRDAGEFFKEAVKVVPPEGGSVAPPGVLWDGTDIWMLPEVNTAPSAGDSKGKGKERESKSSAEGLRAVATRAEALLKQLKHDPEVIKADPEADEKASKLWKEWYTKEIESKDGGIDSVEWQAAVKTALADPVDGGALQRNLSTLVPDVITRETFWTRYFFRVHQVESEEQRRKALLQNTAESEEDFDWESDEDDESSDKAVTPQGRASSLAESTKTLSAVKPDTSLSTTTTNSRVSSEDGSYDVVSSQVSNADETGKPEEQAESGSEDEDEDDEDEDDEEEEEEDDDDDSEEHEEEAEGGEQQTKTQVAKPPATAEAKATKVPQAKAGDDDDDSDWE